MKKKLLGAAVILIVLSMFLSSASGVAVFAASTGPTSNTPLRESSQDKAPSIRGYPILLDSSPQVYTDNTHWWAGSVYPSFLTVQNATTIVASIDVPNSAPLVDEKYYILLSAVDSNGSYDQLGLCNDYGTWTLGYSWTSGPLGDPNSYHSEINSMTLSQGTTYTFNITVKAGVAYFAAYQGSTNVWHQANVTGGYYLMLNSTDPYWGNSRPNFTGGPDYTCYEEVYRTHNSGGAPGFNFYFHDQYWVATNGSSYSPTWTTFAEAAEGYTVPGGISVLIDGSDVYIWNPGVVPSQYPVSVGISSVDPLPPHYSVFQVYHHGMRLNGTSISMSYNVTVSRTDNDTSFGLVYIEYGLNRTNVNNASDYRNIGIANAILGLGGSCNYTFVWNETDTLNPGNYSITGYANVLNDTAFDMNPADNQLTNDTVQAEELVGDINGDAIVDIYDAVIFSIALNSHCANYDYQGEPASPNWNPDADLNLDGVVDIYDSIILASHFGQYIGNGLGGLGSGGSSNGTVQPATGGTPSVVVNPAQQTVFKGEVFAVNVEVTGVTDLQGWEFKLYWNSTVLNCTNVAVQTPSEWQNNTLNFGPGLQANYNATTAMYWQAQVATSPASSFNGSMTIVTLTFQALQIGTTSLTLTDVKLANSTAEPIACSVSSGSVSVYYGRYMRSDTQTINGLGAYKLNIPESTSSASVTQSGDGHGASWGIRAWIRHSNGVEQEISLDGQTGTPKAVVYRTVGSGVQSNTVTVAQTALQQTDSLVVRVYAKVGTSDWTASATFTTEQLQASTLKATTWTLYYYTYAYYYRTYNFTASTFYWGTSTYNSQIQNLQYT